MAKPTKRKPLTKPAANADPAAFFTQEEADKIIALTHGPQSSANPAAVLEAFIKGGEPLVAGGYTVPSIGLGRYMLIEAIKSPVLEPGGWEKMNNTQFAELLFVCLQPEAVSRSLLAKGPEAFSAAVSEHADGVKLSALQELGAAIGIRLAQAFSTILAPSEKKTMTPATAPGAATASAGG